MQRGICARANATSHCSKHRQILDLARPRRKNPSANPSRLHLTIRDGTQLWRLYLNDQLVDGQSFAFQLSGGSDPERRLKLMSRINAWMTPRHRPKRVSAAASFRPSRDAVLHMRTLQAMDSRASGASHKETAEALFGADDVRQLTLV